MSEYVSERLSAEALARRRLEWQRVQARAAVIAWLRKWHPDAWDALNTKALQAFKSTETGQKKFKSMVETKGGKGLYRPDIGNCPDLRPCVDQFLRADLRLFIDRPALNPVILYRDSGRTMLDPDMIDRCDDTGAQGRAQYARDNNATTLWKVHIAEPTPDEPLVVGMTLEGPMPEPAVPAPSFRLTSGPCEDNGEIPF